MMADGDHGRDRSGDGSTHVILGADHRIVSREAAPRRSLAAAAPFSKSLLEFARSSRVSLSRLLRRLGAGGERPTYPSLDPATYAVGDIHGRADLLAKLHQRIDADMAERRPQDALEVYLGDYVDRGPDSRGVLELLIGRALYRRTVFLRGNHDMTFLEFLHGQLPFDLWKATGGAATVESYGVSASGDGERVRTALAASVPSAHLTFLEHLRYFESHGPYLFVHAGIRPRVPLDQQDFGDLMTIRDEFLDYGGRHPQIVVHGHTPAIDPEFKPNRINIDTGAFATNRLTCLRIDQEGAAVL